MKKNHSFTELCDFRKCKTCGEPLKRNLSEKHQDTHFINCYKCTMKQRLLTVPGISKTETRKIMRELTDQAGLTRAGAMVILWGLQAVFFLIFILGM